MARQRVVCVMGRPLDQDDGIGVYTDQLLRNMMALDTVTRYVVLLSTPKHEHLFDAFPNVEVRVLPAPSKLWWDQVTVPLAARRIGADMIFNPKFSLPLLSLRPGVFVLQGSDWYVNPDNYPWWDNLYIRLMLPIYCRKATRLLSISKRTAEDTVKYAGIDGKKITITFAAAAPHFRVVTDRALLDDFAERYKLPPRFILTVARAYHTGHGRHPEYPGGNNENLLLGYRQYRAAGGSLPLVVVGQEIDRYLRARGWGDQELTGVHFTGFVPNEEIVYAYNLAEFFVLATLYESFGLPVIEALSCGCPAIVPTTGACRELAEDAAQYVDPLDPEAIGNAMVGLERERDRRLQMRSAGLRRATEFTWQRTAERTLMVLTSVVSAAS